MRTLANMQCTTLRHGQETATGPGRDCYKESRREVGTGGATETNTRTWQGNLIQSKTKLDTDRRWLCVLRSPTAIADATMQQRSNPVTVVASHEEQPHSARSKCNMAKCLRHAQGLRKKKTIENLWSERIEEAIWGDFAAAFDF